MAAVGEKYKDRGLIDFYGAGVGKPFESKFEILKDYQYCIVVESCFQPYYFSEKLIDPMSVGCMPLYVGKQNERLNNKQCDIVWLISKDEKVSSEIVLRRIDYFARAKDPDGYTIDFLDRDDEETIQTLQKNLGMAYKYRICEDWIYLNYPELFND